MGNTHPQTSTPSGGTGDTSTPTRYPGSPYYFYCDSHADSVTIRMRWGAFGIGFRPADEKLIQFGCDHFQVSWKLQTLGFCAGPLISPCLVYPKIGVTGAVSIGFNAPAHTFEVLYAGKWHTLPTRLWLN